MKRLYYRSPDGDARGYVIPTRETERGYEVSKEQYLRAKKKTGVVIWETCRPVRIEGVDFIRIY